MDFASLQLIKPLFVTSKTGSELILVPLASNINRMTEIFTLNETAAFIWNNLDRAKDQADMARIIADHFDVSPEQAENDLLFFIGKVAGMAGSYK
jgi:hypothetical protein